MTMRILCKEEVNKLPKYPIVIGIPTKNSETTIINVISNIVRGVEMHFSEKVLIVIADGHSKDNTISLAEMFPLPERIDMCVVKDEKPYGKGSGVKSILEIGKKVGAYSTNLIDSDLVAMSSSWVELLAKPTLYGRVGLVSPYYMRHKYDGLLTNMLVYPMTKAIYGGDRRQPIGGDFSMSKPLVSDLLEEKIPHHFGIDIFITTTALVKNYKISEAILGRKIHSSTRKYIDPKKHIDPMFHQVVGQMFEMLERYEDYWTNNTRTEYKNILQEDIGRKPFPIRLEFDKLRGSFKGRCKMNRKVIDDFAGNYDKELGNKIENLIKSDKGIGKKDWVRLVYAAALQYKKNKDKKILEGLLSLWYGRFYNHAKSIEKFNRLESEAVVEDIYKEFKEYKKEFKEKYTKI